MIIVAGHLVVDPDQRQAMLDGCLGVTVAARSAPGCLDFHLTADPIEVDRINIYERWESAEAVETFRGSGLSDDQQRGIRSAAVNQYEIADVTPLS